jgi:ABC-type transporter Mla subunit MlaD
MLGYFQKRKQINQLSALIFILSLIFILNFNFFDINTKNLYFTRIANASGVQLNQPVYFSGYPVGRVKSFKILDNYAILMAFEVDENIPISKDSYVFLGLSSLLSSNKIVLLKVGIEDNYIKNRGSLYDSKIGLDINKLIDLFSYYLSQQKSK